VLPAVSADLLRRHRGAKQPISRIAAIPATSRPGASKSEVSSRAVPGSSLDALREGKTAASGPLKEIYFDFDKYDLSSEARSILKANADWLRANPSVNLEIEGHCDERGTTEYNLALGAKRARSAMDYLVSLGVAPTRIKTVSYGEELPQCNEKSEDCYGKSPRSLCHPRARTRSGQRRIRLRRNLDGLAKYFQCLTS
jgi:peptidoglycan-associated lipoprotein